jgi:hypothetical protein
MEKKKNNQNNVDLKTDIEVDEGFEAYRAMLQRQREFCEKHGLKTVTYVPPNKKDTNGKNID